MRIAILSFYSGVYSRGAETWALNVKKRLDEKIPVDIISGWSTYNPFSWIDANVIVPVNGRAQVFLTRIICWLTGKPMVVFALSGMGADDKWNLWCSPDVFVVSSVRLSEWAHKFKLPWTKVELIHHAVDTEKFTPPTKHSKEKIVLCVAANTPAKRVNLVETAVKLLPGVYFEHVGNPRKTQYDDLPDIYRRATVFCWTPTPWEGFGLVFLEAMASGVPVVTSDDPIRREIVGSAGIFVKNPENAKELAQAIDQAMKTDWKNKPRQQALKFSWDVTVPQYIKMFTNLCSQ